MSAERPFFDSNVLLYLLSEDAVKANQAESIVADGGIISVQVLNEVTSVMRKKLAMPWAEINEVLSLICSLCSVEALTLETHERGRQVAERFGMSIYDAMIVAAALLAGCKKLYSEDMHDGMLIDRQLRICNPFQITKTSKGRNY